MYFLVPKSALDRANADAEFCDFLKNQYPSLLYLKSLDEKKFRIYVKIDTVQNRIIAHDEKIINILSGTERDLKKTVVKRRVVNFLKDIDRPLKIIRTVAVFAAGYYLGQKL